MTFLVLSGLVACSGAPTRPTSEIAATAAPVSGSGDLRLGASLTPEPTGLQKFEVCKQYAGAAGPAVTVNYTVDFDGNGSVETSGSVQLAHGQCAVVHTYQEAGSNSGLQIQRVTVTEQVPTGYSASYTRTVYTLSGSTTTGPVAGNSASGDMLSNPDNGFRVVFTNTAVPTPGIGRFTGGGNQIIVGGVRVSRGLTIHCDRLLSNNLEVNWNGNRFHMEEHLTTVACTDDPAIIQAPPPAPLDTLIGTGIGRYNGVDGYTIEFTLVDYGEPGGDDQARLLIYPTGNPGAPVLNVPLQLLSHGNLQAHYDQPHK
jgi:hypothetical protein